MTNKSNLKSLSRFLQILDGTFPSGVFVHSFGLEPHIINQNVYDISTLKIYLRNIIIDQYQNIEFVYIKKIYDALNNDKIRLIKKMDNTYTSYLTYEYAKASSNIGFNYYTQIKNHISKPIIQKYFTDIQNKQCSGNEIFVLATYAYDLDISLEDFIIMWTKKNLINIAATTLKISRIKPSEIQQMLFEFDEFLADLDFENIKNKITNFNPLFEEHIFQHSVLEPKMFAT
jgi:urease accessory protein